MVNDLSISVREHEIELLWFTSQVSEAAPCPTFVTVWDTLHRSQPWFPEVSYEGWKWEDRENYYRAILPRSARIITGTEFEGKRISKIYNIPEENIAVIPMPGPGDDELSMPGRTKGELLEHFAVDRPYFFYPAQFWAHKNHITLIAVWEKLRRLVEPSKFPYLLLTGEDKGNLGHVLDRIEALGLTSHVRYLGFVTQSDLKGLYENAEALVYPSLAGPDNLPPLEAFAYRCPVITSENPGCAEQLLDCAVFVNPLSVEAWAKQICGILGNPEKRRNMTEKGFSRYLELRPSDYVSKLLNLFDGFSLTRDLWGILPKVQESKLDTEDQLNTIREIAAEDAKSERLTKNITRKLFKDRLKLRVLPDLEPVIERQAQESVLASNDSKSTRKPKATHPEQHAPEITRSLGRIAVDLTPMLPGGINGGAKIFITALISDLAEIRPDLQFILLTREETHDELSDLERPNVKRKLILKRGVQNQRRVNRGLALSLLSMFPQRIKNFFIQNGLSVVLKMKKNRFKSAGESSAFDLLFCPFSAPTYHNETATVSIFYDLQHTEYPQFFDITELAHRDRVIADMCEKSDFIAAISEFSRGSLLSKTGISPERVVAIPICLRQKKREFEAKPSDILRRLKLRPKRYFLYPANFWKHKNHELLLTAFGLASKSGLPEDIKLVCTGHPDERSQALKSAVESMGLEENIVFPGFVTDIEVECLLEQSRALVFPSLYEGFGMPVIQAMSRGVPVACSNGSALKEVAGTAAFLFDPKNPYEIADVLKALGNGDDQLWVSRVENGREQASKFSDATGMAHEYIALFDRALEKQERGYKLLHVFKDGWCKKTILLRLPKIKSAGEIIFSVILPHWLPVSNNVKVVVRLDNRIYDSRQVSKGMPETINLHFSEESREVRLEMSESFVPSEFIDSNDERELSLMMENCTVLETSGGRMQIFEKIIC